MQIDQETKQSLRKTFEEILQKTDEGAKTPIDQQLLEQLLFDTTTIVSNGKTITKKYITWSGPFLQKIDLSGISFDDVVWDTTEYPKEGTYIDLHNTNAKIDFSKAASTTIIGCNLANVDLSQSNGGCLTHIENCNLSRTGIEITPYKEEDTTFFAKDSDLTGARFTKPKVNSILFRGETEDYQIVNCNLSLTGLSISYNDSQLMPFNDESIELYQTLNRKGNLTPEESLQMTSIFAAQAMQTEYVNQGFILSELVLDNKLTGCYIDGHQIVDQNDLPTIYMPSQSLRTFLNTIDSKGVKIPEQIRTKLIETNMPQTRKWQP